MIRSTWIRSFALLAGFAVSLSVGASEVDELKERAEKLRAEAVAQAEAGNGEAASQLKRESVELMQRAEQLIQSEKQKSGDKPREHELKAHQLKERLNDLIAQQKELVQADAPPEKREQIERQIHEIKTALAHHAEKSRPSKPDPKHPLEAALRRIHHLRAAAENLQAAEAHDLAEEVRKKADAIEREAAEAKRRMVEDAERERKDKSPESAQVRELQAEVEHLRAELKELRQSISKP